MASVLCSNCNIGIHYHSEPGDVQYIYINSSDWLKICNSAFDQNSKIIDDHGYPKLFRTDTIEEDFGSLITKVWKCPNCGSIMAFDDEGRVCRTYCKTNEPLDRKLISEGMAFDDYLWAHITETAKPNGVLKTQSPSSFVRVYENGIEVSPDEKFSNVKIYKVSAV